MYLNEMTRVVVEAHRQDMLAQAEAWRRTQSLAAGSGRAFVSVRRDIGNRLVRLGEMVAGHPAPAPCDPAVTAV